MNHIDWACLLAVSSFGIGFVLRGLLERKEANVAANFKARKKLMPPWSPLAVRYRPLPHSGSGVPPIAYIVTMAEHGEALSVRPWSEVQRERESAPKPAPPPLRDLREGEIPKRA